MLPNYLTKLSAVVAALAFHVSAFNPSCNSNYASYYGQNSARNQKSLGEYCKDSTEDVIVLAFMNGFPNLLLNFANACETTFEGSTLLHCPNIAKDIKYCQSQGKAVILSMGGAAGSYGFSGDSDAIAFADTVWDTFFKGKADQRPFDDAVLDGIDLDIEGGSGAGYPAFIKRLRSHYKSDSSRKYYIAGAPQCPFPDVYMSSALNNAWFDMVFVQFYNNYCGLNSYSKWFNFDEWDNWAKTKAVNKDVKVYIGAPGSPSSAGSGYVDGKTLASIYKDVRSKYPSIGGIMTWDVSSARTSGLAKSIRSALDSGGTCKHPENPETSSTSTTSTSSTSNSESSEDSQTGGSLIVTTETQEVTSVSTFVTTIMTEVTTESTFISYLTTVYTYTQTEDDDKTSSAPSTEDTEPNTSTTGPSNPDTDPGTTPSDCPVEGAACTDGTQGCNESGYALCLYGKWIVYPCSTGTACYLFGSTAVCDWENAHDKKTCSIQPIQRAPAKQSNTKQNTSWLSSLTADTRPVSAFTSEGISSRIEYIPLSVSLGRFSALVKLRTLQSPFNNNWLLQFQLPPGQSADHVDRGQLVANGTSVAITSGELGGPILDMAMTFTISGRYTRPYRVPDLTMVRVVNA
ncbi:Chitinase 2 [Coemansia erecta]|nr:Chitinase 2 [Coemansia sp. RSA 2618]KAJ2824998.1 Chitinase 2 [Coemansia erecta]